MKIETDNKIFDEGFFENVFSSLFSYSKYKNMKTDLIETENEYQLIIDLPGYVKEEITIKIKEEYLIVEAKKEKKEVEEKYLYRERVQQRCMRKYFIGEINEEDISAKFENGILIIKISKEKNNDIKEKEIKLE